MTGDSGKLAVGFKQNLLDAIESVLADKTKRQDIEDHRFKARIYRLDEYTHVRVDIKKKVK